MEQRGEGDNVPDYSEATAVDLEGKVSVREVDYYADGNWDFWEYFDYSDDIVAKYRSDTNGDGIIDYGYDQYMDSSGRLDLYLTITMGMATPIFGLRVLLPVESWSVLKPLTEPRFTEIFSFEADFPGI